MQNVVGYVGYLESGQMVVVTGNKTFNNTEALGAAMRHTGPFVRMGSWHILFFKGRNTSQLCTVSEAI